MGIDGSYTRELCAVIAWCSHWGVRGSGNGILLRRCPSVFTAAVQYFGNFPLQAVTRAKKNSVKIIDHKFCEGKAVMQTIIHVFKGVPQSTPQTETAWKVVCRFGNFSLCGSSKLHTKIFPLNKVWVLYEKISIHPRRQTNTHTCEMMLKKFFYAALSLPQSKIWWCDRSKLERGSENAFDWLSKLFDVSKTSHRGRRCLTWYLSCVNWYQSLVN